MVTVQSRCNNSDATGRPTKRDRRHLDTAREVGWGDRWSASVDDDGAGR
jgi:ribosome-associated heat shock protein Hsp15